MPSRRRHRAIKMVAYRHEDYPKGNTFVVLPRALWRSAGICDCKFCKRREGFWDTLAIPPKASPSSPTNAEPYPVHHPGLRKHDLAQMVRVPITAELTQRINKGLESLSGTVGRPLHPSIVEDLNKLAQQSRTRRRAA